MSSTSSATPRSGASPSRDPTFDLGSAIDRSRKVVDQLVGGVETLLESTVSPSTIGDGQPGHEDRSGHTVVVRRQKLRSAQHHHRHGRIDPTHACCADRWQGRHHQPRGAASSQAPARRSSLAPALWVWSSRTSGRAMAPRSPSSRCWIHSCRWKIRTAGRLLKRSFEARGIPVPRENQGRRRRG